MLKMVFNPLQLLGVIILNLRTVFNNKILVQFSIRIFCSAIFYLLAFFPRHSWKQAMCPSPLAGVKQHLNWRDTPGPC